MKNSIKILIIHFVIILCKLVYKCITLIAIEKYCTLSLVVYYLFVITEKSTNNMNAKYKKKNNLTKQIGIM